MPPVRGLTLFQQHVQSWQNCTACYLHEGRSKVVLSRGQVPADVVFIGEAPGESEDALGKPFIGPAGKLLDYIIDKASPHSLCTKCGRVREHGRDKLGLNCANDHEDDPGRPLRIAWTNIVACIPREEDAEGNLLKAGKADQPSVESIQACTPRLQEFIKLARPRLVILVGAMARDWTDWMTPTWAKEAGFEGELYKAELVHPAAILKANVAQKGFMIQRATVSLQSAFERFL